MEKSVFSRPPTCKSCDFRVVILLTDFTRSTVPRLTCSVNVQIVNGGSRINKLFLFVFLCRIILHIISRLLSFFAVRYACAIVLLNRAAYLESLHFGF